MAKQQQRKVSPARRAAQDDDSRLLESAESLARVIGSLQRQLRETLPDFDPDAGPRKHAPARPGRKAHNNSAPVTPVSNGAPSNAAASRKSQRNGGASKRKKR